MTSSTEDTEITLGTGKLLGLFFFLVGICALFFALGYSLGRKSEPSITSASSAAVPQTSPAPSKTGSPQTATPPMTFYKAVEQKDANSQLTPAQAKPDTTAPPANGNAAANVNPAQTPPANAADSTTTLPTGGYLVQVSAVLKQEDADSLVDALKKKDYPAFVAAQSPNDKFFRVQIGPYADIKEAEAIRARLINDGYNPIVKK